MRFSAFWIEFGDVVPVQRPHDTDALDLGGTVAPVGGRNGDPLSREMLGRGGVGSVGQIRATTDMLKTGNARGNCNSELAPKCRSSDKGCRSREGHEGKAGIGLREVTLSGLGVTIL